MQNAARPFCQAKPQENRNGLRKVCAKACIELALIYFKWVEKLVKIPVGMKNPIKDFFPEPKHLVCIDDAKNVRFD